MSSYVHVFARKNDTFVELLCYCRSSELYQVLTHYAPYEKIALFTRERLREACDEIEDKLAIAERLSREDKEMITQIGTWTNTMDEKLEAIGNLQEAINDRRYMIDELTRAQHTLWFLTGVDAPLYIGEECGSDVTVDDIAS